MGLPLLGGAEGAYPINIKLVTGSNDITLTDYKLGYDATTNPRGIASADDYSVWCELFGTYLSFKIVAGGAGHNPSPTDTGVSKNGTGFELQATADLNNVYVVIWIIPSGGVMRTVI